MTSVVTEAAPVHMPKKAATAAFLGSALEYYDYFIYGTAAALVFGELFFPQDNPTVATVLALATFGIGYLARPIGGLFFGHFGDKLGRKKMLMLTLVIMGVASIAIGLLPTYETIGVWAPILLVVCRLAQGFSAGGEAAGASSLTIEHAPAHRRAFFSGFVMTGFAAGMVLATVVFIPVTLMPEDAMRSWGWRVPFLLSFLVLVVAYWVRAKLDETPVFHETVTTDATHAVPAADVLKRQWRDVLRVVLLSLFAVTQTLFTVFGLRYATEYAGVERAHYLVLTAVAIGGSILTIPIVTIWSDRVGRKPVWITGAIGSALTLALFLWSLHSGSVFLVYLAGIANMTVFYAMLNGLWPAFFTEMFAAPVRYTGFAIGTQLGFLIAGFSPAIAYSVMNEGPLGWIPVALFAGACLGISAVTALTAKETHRVPTEELGWENYHGRRTAG